MGNDFLTSLIRTYVPIIVGGLASWLATSGVVLDDGAQKGLGIFLAGLFAGIYYLVVRLLEKKFPKFGVLLGSSKAPEYPAKSAVEKDLDSK